MEGPGVLRIASLVVDASIFAAFAWFLFHGRTPRRWLGTLGLLTGVALLNLTQSVIALGEPVGPLLSTDRLVHAGEVTILAATVVVFRHEMLQPTRLLRKVANRRDIADSELDGIAAPVVSLTRDGVVRHANARAAELLGVDQASLVGTDLFRLMGTPEQGRQGRQAFLRFVGSAGTVAFTPEHRLRTPEGEVLIRWHASAQVDRTGAVVGVVYYGEDLTERRRVERQLEAESQLLDSVREAVLVSGPDGGYVYFNRAAHDILGLSRDEFQSLSPWEWLAPDSVPLMLDHLQSVSDATDDPIEVVAVRRDGTRVPLEVHVQCIEFDGKSCTMTVMRDVSSRHQAQSLMTRMAFTDPLTGLPNRRAVEARLGHVLGRCREGGPAPSVLYLDVDNVKSINDSLGHDAGDRLIGIVGGRLQSLLREGDMVGRMGGDEFVIVLPDGSRNGVSDQVAQRLLEGVGVPLRLDGHELRLGASIGVVDCGPEMSVEEAIISADRAMYTAKRSGGRRVVRHEPAMDEEFIDRFTLKNDLARALELREFSLDFQPIVAAGSGRVIAAEALLRWRHPERGILAPGAFIALAEQAGITRELGRWVIAEACAALVGWRESGVHLERVTVNVSPFQLRDHFFVPDLLAAIALHGLQPGNVEVEITESEAIEHVHELEGVFVALREAGVRIALDDFGVGHSSLERLRRLPISTLKLDRTFVADLCTASEVHPIVDTVLVLASNLRLDVVAEGVETSCQADYLRDAGCQLLQGFAFARPMDAASFGRVCTGLLQAAPCVEAEGCPGRAGVGAWGLLPARLSGVAADLA